MEVGTAETISTPKKRRQRRSGFTSGGGGGPRGRGGNGGDGGGGGGSDDFGSRGAAHHEEEGHPGDKAKVLTFFLLLVVLMTFGGLIGAYIVIATNGALEWSPFALPIQVWFSTAIIIASSITYVIAERSIYAEDQPKAKKFLIATTALGAAFIASQLIVWLELVNRGFYVYANPYAGFFYILTAIHAIHVLGGVIALGAIVLRSWNPVSSEYQIIRTKYLARSVGWYWHFMGGLWIVLLSLLAFWK